MNCMSPEDIQLSKDLLPHLPTEVIAEKMEVPHSVLIQNIYNCDFDMPSRLFNLRLKRGTIRVSGDDLEKLCARCDDYFPFIIEFWQKNRNETDGANGMCRACENERKAALRAKRARH